MTFHEEVIIRLDCDTLERCLAHIEDFYNKMCVSTNSIKRKDYGEAILAIMEEQPETKKFWHYYPNNFCWIDRFSKVVDGEEVTPISNSTVFIDQTTCLKNAPKVSGLYFFGMVQANPHTGKLYYWVKIGKSKNLAERVRAYGTYSPMPFVIGYMATNNYDYLEHYYQRQIQSKAICLGQNSNEWWMVDRETYLAMCEKNFDYFS
jgi:hypothetical protein